MGFLGTRAAVLHQVAILDDIERLLAQVGGWLDGRVAGWLPDWMAGCVCAPVCEDCGGCRKACCCVQPMLVRRLAPQDNSWSTDISITCSLAPLSLLLRLLLLCPLVPTRLRCTT